MMFLTALISYLLGSIPTAFIIGKIFFDIDVRSIGSGNVGTTNAIRAFGKKAGFATFAVDMLKGFIAAYIGKRLAGDTGMAVATFFVVFGHMYSVFLKFKSGKGVATTFGALLFVDYKYALALLAIFVLIVLLGGIVSLSSVITAGITFISSYLLYGLSPLFIALAILSLLVIYKHRANIDRLRKGEESRLFIPKY